MKQEAVTKIEDILTDLLTSKVILPQKAFTLAETLITIGIIGVVAAMTLPSLIEKHQKKETVTKLKVFNSIMSQAFVTAKTEYGDFTNWDSNTFGDTTSGDGEKQLQWLEKYLLPYIKYTEKTTKHKYSLVALPNGSGFSNYNNLYFFCVRFSDCKKTSEIYNKRTRFIFQFDTTDGFVPYSCGFEGTREELFKKNSCGHACSKTDSGLCAKLIQYDGWEIKEDYPW